MRARSKSAALAYDPIMLSAIAMDRVRVGTSGGRKKGVRFRNHPCAPAV